MGNATNLEQEDVLCMFFFFSLSFLFLFFIFYDKEPAASWIAVIPLSLCWVYMFTSYMLHVCIVKSIVN